MSFHARRLHPPHECAYRSSCCQEQMGRGKKPWEVEQPLFPLVQVSVLENHMFFFKYLTFKCPLLLYPTCFKEQFLPPMGLWAATGGWVSAVVFQEGPCKQGPTSLHGILVSVLAVAVLDILLFKGWWFLGSACVLVSPAAMAFELHPWPDFVLGGETQLCFGRGKGGGQAPGPLSSSGLCFDPLQSSGAGAAHGHVSHCSPGGSCCF